MGWALAPNQPPRVFGRSAVGDRWWSSVGWIPSGCAWHVGGRGLGRHGGEMAHDWRKSTHRNLMEWYNQHTEAEAERLWQTGSPT